MKYQDKCKLLNRILELHTNMYDLEPLLSPDVQDSKTREYDQLESEKEKLIKQLLEHG